MASRALVLAFIDELAIYGYKPEYPDDTVHIRFTLILDGTECHVMCNHMLACFCISIVNSYTGKRYGYGAMKIETIMESLRLNGLMHNPSRGHMYSLTYS